MSKRSDFCISVGLPRTLFFLFFFFSCTSTLQFGVLKFPSLFSSCRPSHGHLLEFVSHWFFLFGVDIRTFSRTEIKMASDSAVCLSKYSILQLLMQSSTWLSENWKLGSNLNYNPIEFRNKIVMISLRRGDLANFSGNISFQLCLFFNFCFVVFFFSFTRVQQNWSNL